MLDVIASHKDEFQGRLKLRVGGNGEVDKVKALIKAQGISDIVRISLRRLLVRVESIPYILLSPLNGHRNCRRPCCHNVAII